MASGRLLNRKIILSRKINSISDGAENLYYRLLVMSDDFGCYHADPQIIKGTIYTLKKISIANIENRLKELNAIRLIKIYKINGEMYLQIGQFEKNQKFRADIKRRSEYPGFQQGSRIESARICTDLNTDTSQQNRNNNDNEDKNNNNNENENKELRHKIIKYLNKKADRKFNIDSDNAIKYINSRIRDGATWENFKHVILVKVADWENDSKMNKFLRPETLFNKTKFESYRNEKMPNKINQGEQDGKPSKYAHLYKED